jgi:hypothetical protein
MGEVAIRILILLGAVLPVGCSHQGRVPQTSPDYEAPLPAVAPDTTPSWFYDDSSYTSSSPRYLKRVIGIEFHKSADLAAREQVVRSVGGQVAGGWRFSPTREGLYAVLLPRAQSRAEMSELLAELRKLPQIKAAIHIMAVEALPAGAR